MAADEPFQHNVAHVTAIVVSFLLAVVQLIFGFFSYAGYGFFSSTLAELNEKYATEANPYYSLPIIGLIVFAIQIPWTVYNITTVWREGANDYLYVSPNALHVIVNIAFIITTGLNIAWFFVWDQEILIAEICVLLVAAIFSAVALGAAVYLFYLRVGELEKLQKTADIFFHRFLVHNGLAAFTAWFFMYCCVQASVVATFEGSMSDHDASTMAIGLMFFVVLLTIIVQDFILNKYFHYCFANYAVWVAILIPIVVKFDADNRNDILACVLLVIIAVFLAIKLYRFCCASCCNDEGEEIEVKSVPYTETALAIPGDFHPVVVETKKIKVAKKVKKVEIDCDGEIDLGDPGRFNPPVSNYRIIQTPAQCEMLTTEPRVAYQPVEVLNIPQTQTVPVYAAQQINHAPIIPQEAQLYYNPGQPQSLLQQSSYNPAPQQSVYNSGSVTIEPVTNPNMLSMNALKNLSGTPMGIMSLPKSAIPQPQPPPPAPTCASTYGTCGNHQLNHQPTMQLNQQPMMQLNQQPIMQPMYGTSGNVQRSCGGNVHLNQMPSPCQCQQRY